MHLTALPVELQHGACEQHAPRHLEGHPPEHVLQLARVGVEGGLVQLLGSPHLRGHTSCTSRHRHRHISRVTLPLLSRVTSPLLSGVTCHLCLRGARGLRARPVLLQQLLGLHQALVAHQPVHGVGHPGEISEPAWVGTVDQ